MSELPVNRVIAGDCIEVMRGFPEESINLVMFSPPYWGLRDYGIEGQIGLEPTYQEYVAKMVGVGREVRRVLRSDGSWYLNLGDTYAGSGCGAQHGWGDYKREKVIGTMSEPSPQTKMKGMEKCKLLIPYRVALALIDDGWTCRNDITWYKPNAMPSSVKDRLNCQTERVFHLVKSRTYYYDLDAIREPHATSSFKRQACPSPTLAYGQRGHGQRRGVHSEEAASVRRWDSGAEGDFFVALGDHLYGGRGAG